MRLLTMDRCHADSLHVLSAGITVDLIREMFLPNNKDLSRMTASEKDELMFVLFPIVAAGDLCADSTGAVAILAYWLLVRTIAGGRVDSSEFRTVKHMAKSLKYFWYELSPRLFTLKLHVFLDHAIQQDMEYCGTPYHWTSGGFESLHRSLQLRIPQCTTNCEEVVIKNFMLRKELFNLFEDVAENTSNPAFKRLRDKIVLGDANRFPVEIDLVDHWSVPTKSTIEFEDLYGDHKLFLTRFRSHCSFSSRVLYKNKPFISRLYWSRGSHSSQNYVMLNVDAAHDCVFGSVAVFAFDPETKDCFVLLEEFCTTDPFRRLAYSLERGVCLSKNRAVNTLKMVRKTNRFFKEIVGQRFRIGRSITSPPLF
ncbi:hypothetical protein Aduo_015763 [Ancylostoma duodenale]